MIMNTHCPSVRRSTVIGRWVEILVDGVLFAGTVMDNVSGTSLPKRVRIQRGYRQGDVVQPGEYEIHQFINPEEVDP